MIVKKLIRQKSGVYTLTIPKNIVEAKGWQTAEMKLEIKGDKIILSKISK